MDKSMQSPMYPIKNAHVPRNRLSMTNSMISSRKSIGGMKMGTQGRYSISGRSTQSLQVIAKSEYNVVEPFGLPLPVLVNEALTFSERNIIVSINCSSNGWAWAVCGRRLLIWQFKETRIDLSKADISRTPQRRPTTAQCRELTLPNSDIGHKASLVEVFVSDGQQMPSCLAVSPTGDVRYWPSIAHDGSSIDLNGILEGQEFDKIISISPQGYVLATTTCNLVWLQLQLQNGRHAIFHRTIKAPSGFLGGIGKKFASILIGMNSNQDKEFKLLKICAENSGTTDWVVSILADKWIQRWLFSGNGNESFLFEDSEILKKIRESYQKKIWSNRETNEIQVWMIDLQPSDSGLIILTAAINLQHSPQVHYALIQLNDDETSFSVGNFRHLSFSFVVFYTPETEEEILGMKFMLNRGVAYVYGEKIIHPVYMNGTGNDEVEKIEFQSQNDKIMSAATYNNIPLFFSRIHGLVCVAASDFEPTDILNSSEILSPSFDQSFAQSPNVTNAGYLTMYELDPEEIYNSNKDTISQLKAAFIYHLKKNSSMCTAILKELFSDSVQISVTDSILDQSVLRIAQDLAEDVPAGDPRWEQEDLNQRHALGSSASLQIVQQLREKNMALNHFVEFLHSTGLWNKLSAVSTKGSVRSTCHILSDINEKIIAGIALKCIHQNHSKLIDEAIQKVLQQRNDQTYGSLTNQDLFYVKITKIQEFFKVLGNISNEFIKKESLSAEIGMLLVEINTIMLTVLSEVNQFRNSKQKQFELPAEKLNEFEYNPWTSLTGRYGLRDTILQLINTTLLHGARGTAEPQLRQKHYQQIVDLIDYHLDGKKNYLESIRNSEKYSIVLQQYQSQCSELIYPLVEDEQYELAAKLGEKYHDFQTLIVICDKTKNQSRLDEYIERYEKFNFSQFAIKWHLRQQKQGDIFERFKGNQPALAKFLGDHPSLAWVQLIFNGELNKAATILFSLSQNETELVTRKKTMLSLSKLAALSSDIDFALQISEINRELNLIAHQEELPASILLDFGYDVKNPKVLKAEEIINLYISEENASANEYDFRKSLELLNYVEEPFEVRHKIWCAAILKDTWKGYDMNSPLDGMQNMMFFKLIDLCYLMDSELDDFLPSLEDFLHSTDLGDLIEEKSFQFLIKFGYEHIYQTYKSQLC